MLENNELQIEQFTWDIVDSNSFLIIEGNNGLLIDAVDDKNLYRALQIVDDLTIILTDCRVISTASCSENIGNIHRNMSAAATVFMKFYKADSDVEIESFTCEPADRTFENEMEFYWNGLNFHLIAVHGHSNDSLLVILDEKYLFSGDTLLFIPTVTRFPGGNTAMFWKEDVPRLIELKSIITVYPGHGDSGKIEDMLAANKKPQKYK